MTINPGTQIDAAALDNLRFYKVEEVEKIVEEIHKSNFDNSTFENTDFKNTDYLFFRDNKDQYWMINIPTKQWITIVNHKPVMSAKPETAIEGSATLKHFSIQELEELLLDNSTETSLSIVDGSSSSNDCRMAFTEIISGTYRKYREGKLTSDETELLLSTYILIDHECNIWTLGCHSGYWYIFRDGNWEETKLTPPQEKDRKLHENEKIEEKKKKILSDFVLNGANSLPEKVSPQWSSRKINELKDFIGDGHPSTSSENTSIRGKIRCEKCNNSINPQLKFCIHCGSKVSAMNSSLQVRICQQCGNQCKSEEKFCTNCGTRLIGD